MYENRITVFIDILGFRNIVNQTNSNDDYAKKIFEVLNSMRSEQIIDELFVEVNDIEDGKENIEEVKEHARKMSQALFGQSSIKVTHFSDSIVLSIGLENDMFAMSLIEYLARLIYRLWRDFKILLRGGVCVGKLVHQENGALFGPSMVRAYDLETNLSVYPRIIFDDFCFNIIKSSPSFKGMKNLFIPFSGKKEVQGNLVEVKRGFEMNLATVFNHLINSHFTFHPGKRVQVLDEISNSVKHLEDAVKEIDNQKVLDKYMYLIGQLEGIDYPKR